MHVGMRMASDPHAIVACTAAALAAQELLRHSPGGVEFTRTRRAQKQIRVARPARSDGMGEKIAHARLRLELRQQASIG